MDFRKNFWQIGDYFKSRKRLIIAIFLSLLLFLVLFSNFGVIKRVNLEIAKSNLNDQILSAKLEQDSLNDKISNLKSNLHEIERIAREKYGMIRRGEKVFIVPKDNKAIK